MTEKLLTIDSAPTNRERDSESGWLHVKNNRLTQDQVAPYFGHEIPQAQEHGLEPDRIYYAWRHPEELEKAVDRFNGIPLLIEHKTDSADKPLQTERVGSVGTSARWDAPYIYNTLSVWDSDAIDKIEDGSLRDLSVGYRYDPDFTPGKTPDGVEYDLIMRNIRPNHVALVADGRAPDCLVADSNIGVINMEEDDKKQEEKRVATDASDFTEFVRQTLENSGVELSAENLDKIVRTFAESHAQYEEAKAAEAKREIEGTRDDELTQTPPAQTVANDDDDVDFQSEAERRAFEAGVRYGEKREKADPARIDRDHERDGEERYLNRTDDNCPVANDADSIAKAVRTYLAEQFKAAADVRSVLGEVDVMSFDSAGAIYVEALKNMGVVAHVNPQNAKSIFLALSENRGSRTMASDSQSVSGQEEFISKMFQ